MSGGAYMNMTNIIIRHEARIAELEAQAVIFEKQIAELTPKPVISTSWRNLYNDYGVFSTLRDAESSRCTGFIGVVRVDKIIYPDGKVEYKLEVEE